MFVFHVFSFVFNASNSVNADAAAVAAAATKRRQTTAETREAFQAAKLGSSISN